MKLMKFSRRDSLENNRSLDQIDRITRTYDQET